MEAARLSTLLSRHQPIDEKPATARRNVGAGRFYVVGAQPGRRLRVMMLSWEYPPVVVGGLGRHVHALATNLAAAGHDVTVVTRHGFDAPLDEYHEGVRIVRAPEDPPAVPLATPSLLAWTMAFNHALTRAALHAASTGAYDVIHAHDWLVTHTAMTMREHLGVPLVTTLHATEAGRHQGWLPGDLNRTIHGVEWWLARESDQLISCSEYMRWEISRLLDVPTGKVQVIPNGVHAPAWQPSAGAVLAARAHYAGDGPLLGFAGRLVYEKGVQFLIDALPRLRHDHPGLRLVVAGDGPFRPDLHARVARLGLTDAVHFTGFLGERLPALFAATDSVVVPSLYEPFGMVALEACASGAPVAASATGGLAEIVDHGVTGMTFPTRDAEGLADVVTTLLADRSRARRLARSARRMVQAHYGWEGIAARTADTYRAVVAMNVTRPGGTRSVAPSAPVVPADRNLLATTDH